MSPQQASIDPAAAPPEEGVITHPDGSLSIRSPWARFTPLARLGLAFASLTASLASQARSVAFLIGAVVFTAYALLVAIRRPARGGIFGLLTLFADTIFFLAIANLSAGQAAWLAPTFYLFLLATVLEHYGPREVLIIAGLTISFCALGGQPHLRDLLRMMLVSGSLAGIFSLQKRRLEQRVQTSLQDAAAAKELARTATIAERRRVAADFHDGPLQSFISFQMRLEILRKLLERDVASGLQELAQLQQLATGQIRQLRAFVRSMRPVEVDSTNLAGSIRRIVEDFQKEAGIAVTFTGSEAVITTSQETGAEVLQMVRESLNNIMKHARAARAAVTLEKKGKAMDLSIDDNGSGFPFSGAYSLDELEMLRLGPVSLRQRARAVNAEMVLESRPGRGSSIRLRIPIL